MQTIHKLYRRDYQGENINLERVFENQKWSTTSSYIPNDEINYYSWTNAVIIGNGQSRLEIDNKFFKKILDKTNNHVTFQTYGCNALYRDFSPDFLVAVGEVITEEIVQSGYCDNHIVFANSDLVVKYPNKFMLIPQDPKWNAGALATYLACFDGHKKIFLLGFDNGDSKNLNVYANTNGYLPTEQAPTDDFWIKAMSNVFQTYNDVEFIRVAVNELVQTPEEWKYFTNFKTISFRQFVIEADL